MNREFKNFFLTAACLLVFGTMVTHNAKAQDSSGVSCLGRYWYSYTTDVAVRGDFAYLADGDAGLRIVNISNRAAPQEITLLELYGSANGLELSGNYCYLADGWSGLRIVNISDPSSPTLTSTFATEGSAQNVAIGGNFAYIAEWNTENRGGLRIVDISDPENPAQVGFCNLGSQEGLAVRGDFAYVFGLGRLNVIYIRDPTRPDLVSTTLTPHPVELVLADRYAYLTSSSVGLVVIDLIMPDSPSIVGHWEAPDLTMGVTLIDTLAYLACYGDGLFILNVSNPLRPVELGSCDLPENSYTVSVSGGTAYIANSYNGLRIVDVSNPAQPQEVGSFAKPGYPLAFSLYGNLAYLLGGNGLEIFDVSDVESPQLLGYSGPGLNGRTVAVNDGYAYAGASYEGLRVFDVSNPESPRFVATLDTGVFITDIVTNGNYAYSTSTSSGDLNGLNIFNISDPESPRFVVNWNDSTNGSWCIAIREDLIFLTTFRTIVPGLFIIDVEDPANPTKISFTPIIDGTATNDIVVVDDYAYLLGSELCVFDVSTPESPHEIGRFGQGGMSLSIEDGYAFIAVDQHGFHVINISNPTNMHEVGFYDSNGQVWSVAARGSTAYIVSLSQEFGIYDCSAAMSAIERVGNEVPDAFELFANYPNPFNATTELRYSVPNTSKVTLSIHDTEGREVKRLLDFSQHPGTYRLSFNAEGLPAGAYIARLAAGEFSASQKLLLLK